MSDDYRAKAYEVVSRHMETGEPINMTRLHDLLGKETGSSEWPVDGFFEAPEREALTRIQRAGNDSHPVAIWMQKVAAHALEPQRWPDPGEQPAGPFPHELSNDDLKDMAHVVIVSPSDGPPEVYEFEPGEGAMLKAHEFAQREGATRTQRLFRVSVAMRYRQMTCGTGR